MPRLTTPTAYQTLDKLLDVHGGQTVAVQIVSGTKRGTIRRLRQAADSRDEAERQFALWLASRERLLPLATKPLTQATVTFNQLASEFLDYSKSPQANFSPNTIKCYGIALGKFIAQWGFNDISDITPAFLGRWADTQTDRKPATFFFDVMLLKSVFRLAIERGYLDANPVQSLRARTPRKTVPKHMTDEQLTALLQCAAEMDIERLNVPEARARIFGLVPNYRKYYNADGECRLGARVCGPCRHQNHAQIRPHPRRRTPGGDTRVNTVGNRFVRPFA